MVNAQNDGRNHISRAFVSRMSHMSAEPGDAANTLPYGYRPSLMGAPWQFTLTDDAIAWSIGRQTGRMAYDKVRYVRMSYRPASMQQHRFVTEVWADEGPKLPIVSASWKSMFEQERFDQPYTEFVRELHRRVVQAGGAVDYEQGRNPLIYWLAVAVFAGVTFALMLLVVRALQSAAPGGAAFIVAFGALFLWRGINFLRRNRPGVYQPDALPAQLLP
jgi:hypothetical protein